MSLKRQTAWIMLPLLVVSVLNFISVPLFLRFLGDEMYTLSAYIVTYSAMFGFADLGLGVTVGRFMGVALGQNDNSAAREYWATGNAIVLPLVAGTSLVFMVVGVFFIPAWVNVADKDVNLLRACFLVGGASLFLNYCMQLWVVLLQVHLNFKLLGLVRTAGSLAQVVPGVIIAWATRNPLWISAWSFGITLTQFVIYVIYARRCYDLGFEFRSARRARAREMAGYTTKIFANLFVGGMFSQIDRVILSPLASAADFARYNVAANIGTRLQGLGMAVMPPVFHNTALAEGRGKPESTRAIFGEMFGFTFGWYALVAVWVSVWHPLFLHLWLDTLTQKNTGAAVAPVFTPLVIGYCLTALAGTSGSQLSAMNRAGTALFFVVATGLATAAGAWIGWRLYGVVGVAWGFLAGRLVFVAQDIFAARLVGAAGWCDAKLWLGLLAQVALGGAFALLFLVFPRDSLWMIIPAVLHGGLVAVWLLRHSLRHRFGKFFAPQPASASDQVIES